MPETRDTPETPLNALIVYAHPEPRSFNGALRDIAADTLRGRGHRVEISDLYAEGFDPAEGPKHYARDTKSEYAKAGRPERFAALAEQRHAGATGTLPGDIVREMARLERADLVILQFPLWWHAQPAILKGWFDRVFVSGALYTSTMRYDRGYFRGARAICSVTTGAPEADFGPSARGGDMERLLWPIHYSLYYMGFDVLPPFIAHGIQGHGYAYRDEADFDGHLAAAKAAWARRLEALDGDAALPFPGWDDWEAEAKQVGDKEKTGCLAG